MKAKDCPTCGQSINSPYKRNYASARCAECGRRGALRKDGTMKAHNIGRRDARRIGPRPDDYDIWKDPEWYAGKCLGTHQPGTDYKDAGWLDKRKDG